MARTTDQAEKAKAGIEKNLAKFTASLEQNPGNKIFTERVNTLTADLEVVNAELGV